MLPEMLDILRVDQVLFLGVLIVISGSHQPSKGSRPYRPRIELSLLPVVNLVLHLHVPVMPGPRAKVGQRALSLLREGRPFRPLDVPVAVRIHQAPDFAQDLVFLRLRYVFRSLVFHAVGLEDLAAVPVAVVVVIVKREERRRVEVVDVVLACSWVRKRRGGLC